MEHKKRERRREKEREREYTAKEEGAKTRRETN